MTGSNNFTECLTEYQLQSYVSGTMTHEELRKAELHITDCELCSDAIVGLRMMDDPAKAEVIVNDIKHSINKKIRGNVKPLTQFNWLQVAAVLFIIALSAGGYYLVSTLSNENIALQKENNKPDFSSAPEVNSDQSVISNTDTKSEAEKITNEPIAPVNNPPAVLQRESTTAIQDENNIAREEKKDFEDVTESKDANADDYSGSSASGTPAIKEKAFSNAEMQQPAVPAATESDASLSKKSQRAATKYDIQSTAPQATNVEMPDKYQEGLRLYQEKKYSESLSVFNEVIISGSKHADDAKWYAADIYLRLDKKQEAIQLLESLSDSKEYKSKAAKLLKELR